MESRIDPAAQSQDHLALVSLDDSHAAPFAQEWVTLTKQQFIELEASAHYWQAQHSRAKARIETLEQALLRKEAEVKSLRKRLFGKKSEKHRAKSTAAAGGTTTPGVPGTADVSETAPRRRGQQPGASGHGRTHRPALPVIVENLDVAEADRSCPLCGRLYQPKPALDEVSDVIEIQVQAHCRRIRRRTYARGPGCRCADSPPLITAAPPARLFPHTPYGVSVWVSVILSKFHYSQPLHRFCQTLEEVGLPIAPGTLASRLPALAPLLEPVVQALYRRQMTETVFHNDETRWEVFEAMEGKVGSRWYLWVTRSDSVVYFCLDPSRSAAVPGAHFAGLTAEQVIIVCDRYSAYKKLARLSGNIVLAFCWAHVRRDFLEAGSAMAELEAWALDWKARIGQLYALNRERLAHWQMGCPLTEQNAAFQQAHQALKSALQGLHDDATQALEAPVEKKPAGTTAYAAPLSKSASNRQHKVYRSLLEHWPGLIRFIDHPEVPMDNNKAENSLRNSVVGRNNYYGSGSVASAELTALLFTLLRTLVLWGINPRQWLTEYLNTCAALGGKAPDVIDGYLPWQRPEATKPGKQAAPPTPTSSNTTRAPPPIRH